MFGPNNDAFARQHRQDVIEMAKKKLVRESVSQPVRLEFNRLPNDDTYEGITLRTKNIWFVAPEPGGKRTNPVKVERIKDGRWTCSHKGWKPNADCKHISRVRHMLGEDGVVPYDGRRRRPLTKWLFGEHSQAEDTRRNRAREAEPIKVPQLAVELCKRFVTQPERSETNSADGGATGVPLAVRVFALLMKVFWNVTYAQLRHQIGLEGAIWDLGFMKLKTPSKNSMMSWFGDPRLLDILKQLFIVSTKPTGRVDTMVLGDSHDIPTRQVDNSRDRKFGPKPATYRNKDRPLVRQHFAVGKVSGIITAADITLTTGAGSNDSVHLPSLLEQTKASNPGVTVATFDKAYGGRPNFGAAEGLGVDLYVREKSGEDRVAEDWPTSAQMLTNIERTYPAAYADVYRFRSKAELTPARIKARNPYMRLRRRMKDPTPTIPPGIEGKPFAELTEDVRQAVFEAATESVGIARLNEAWAILIIANLRTLNLLEHLLGQHVTFETDVTLNPPLEMREEDVA